MSFAAILIMRIPSRPTVLTTYLKHGWETSFDAIQCDSQQEITASLSDVTHLPSPCPSRTNLVLCSHLNVSSAARFESG